MSLTDTGSQLPNRNLSKGFHRLIQESLAMSQSPPCHMSYSTAAATHHPSAPLDTREVAQSQECDGAFIYAPGTNILEV